jgi:SAM-dependent methyltransferase
LLHLDVCDWASNTIRSHNRISYYSQSWTQLRHTITGRLGVNGNTRSEIRCPACGQNSEPRNNSLGGFQIFACKECELRFAPEAFDLKVDYTALYHSDCYKETQVQAIQSSTDFRAFADHPTYRPFFRQVRRHRDATLLDVGCGVGRFCHAASYLRWDVTGIDVSEAAIKIGSEHATFPMEHTTIGAHLARNTKYDAVTAFEVLEHLSEPLKFLQSLKEAARPHGHVFCTVPNWDCLTIQTATRPDWLPPVHLCFFSRKALENLALLAGFYTVNVGLISTDPFPGLSLRSARWLAKRALGRRGDDLGLWLHCRTKALAH